MHKVVDIAAGIIVLAGIFVLVRPGSQGPSMVETLTNGFTGAIKAATGGGTWSGK